jgi:hypothetical protein
LFKGAKATVARRHLDAATLLICLNQDKGARETTSPRIVFFEVDSIQCFDFAPGYKRQDRREEATNKSILASRDLSGVRSPV